LKNIPIGAGLGAGSANGAMTLSALNDIFQLQLDAQQLANYALELGSDCPFFIYNRPCIASGRGQELTPLALDLTGYVLQIVNPGIHISTPWAFSKIKPKEVTVDYQSIFSQPPASWK